MVTRHQFKNLCKSGIYLDCLPWNKSGLIPLSQWFKVFKTGFNEFQTKLDYNSFRIQTCNLNCNLDKELRLFSICNWFSRLNPPRHKQGSISGYSLNQYQGQTQNFFLIRINHKLSQLKELTIRIGFGLVVAAGLGFVFWWLKQQF